MCQAGRLEPLGAVNLVVADNVADAIGKNLRAAPGQRIHSRSLQLPQCLAGGELRALRQVRNLDHSKGFQVNLWKTLLQARDEVQKILEWQVGMQASDDVKFRDCLAIAGRSGLEGFLQCHGIGARCVFLSPESTEPASR